MHKPESVQALNVVGHKAQTRAKTEQSGDADRAKRLAELRNQIRSGRYQPDIRDVAMGLIRDDLSPFA